MAAFAYIGDHAGTECFGIRFPRDIPVEVLDERAARKLANNRDFVPVHDGVQVLDAPETQPEPQSEPPQKRRGRPPKER